MTPLFYENRKQDLAFEKPSGKSARTRHHVRFWKALDAGDDGLPVWLGAAVFDDGLGVSHYTGQVTHHTGPDIDAERDFLMSDLEQAKKVKEIYRSAGSARRCFRATAGAIPISPMATSPLPGWSQAARARRARRGRCSKRLGSWRKTRSSRGSPRYGAGCMVHGPPPSSWRGAFNRSPRFGNRSIRARRRKGNPQRRERVAQCWSPCRHAIRPRTAPPGRSRRR